MKLRVKELTICAMFAALIAVGAFLKLDIPLPVYTMHFTLQWLFVIIASLLLGAKLGMLSVVVYLCIGLAGIPVFAAGGGIGYVFRPGFGFLLGFAVAAFIMGWITEHIKNVNLWLYIGISTVGMVVYYLLGAVYFYLIKNLYAGVPIAFVVVVVDYCLITVVPDFLLCVMASCFVQKVRKPLKIMINN